MSNMTIDEFNVFASTLPDGVDRKKIARALGLQLPKEPAPPISDQLTAMKVIKHTPKSDDSKTVSVEREYIEIPALKLDGDTGTRKVWIRTEIAREAFLKGLELCDKHNL